MNNVPARIASRLLRIPFASFSTDSKMNWITVENPIKDRVMSTSTWPAPYYQRIAKAYPVRSKQNEVSLLLADINVDDTNWHMAKETLNQTARGRQIVEYTENHVKTDTYLIRQKDSAAMAKGYVEDIVQFLDVANKENKRILSTTNLI